MEAEWRNCKRALQIELDRTLATSSLTRKRSARPLPIGSWTDATSPVSNINSACPSSLNFIELRWLTWSRAISSGLQAFCSVSRLRTRVGTLDIHADTGCTGPIPFSTAPRTDVVMLGTAMTAFEKVPHAETSCLAILDTTKVQATGSALAFPLDSVLLAGLALGAKLVCLRS